MSPIETKKSTTVEPDYCNIAEAQGKNFKMAVMYVLEILK